MLTRQQKLQIFGLRNSGHTFKEIADLLELPLQTVYSSYARNKPSLPERKDKKCLQCGAPINGRKKFCSEECQTIWWKEHPEARTISPGAIYKYTCEGCGKTFTIYGHSTRKFCSHECYIKSRFHKDK